MKVYVLTKEYNDYDQHGEYFIAVFNGIPKPQQLWDLGVPVNRTKHVQNGGGRWDNSENEWYHLTPVRVRDAN